MPIWANSGTNVVTPSSSFQDDGFDPNLPFPVEFLNWKLNELDTGGYVTHNYGGSSTGLALRAGDTASGEIVELLLDTDSWVFSTYSGGTLEAPTGQTGQLAWTTSSNVWLFTDRVQAGLGFIADANTSSPVPSRYGYGTGMDITHHLADGVGGWARSSPIGGSITSSQISYALGTHALSFQITTSAGISVEFNRDISHLLKENAEWSSSSFYTLYFKQLEATLTDGSGTTVAVDIQKVDRTSGGGSTILSITSGAPSDNNSGVVQELDIANYAYVLRVVCTAAAAASADTCTVKNLKLTMTHLAVE